MSHTTDCARRSITRGRGASDRSLARGAKSVLLEVPVATLCPTGGADTLAKSNWLRDGIANWSFTSSRWLSPAGATAGVCTSGTKCARIGLGETACEGRASCADFVAEVASAGGPGRRKRCNCGAPS